MDGFSHYLKARVRTFYRKGAEKIRQRLLFYRLKDGMISLDSKGYRVPLLNVQGLSDRFGLQTGICIQGLGSVL